MVKRILVLVAAGVMSFGGLEGADVELDKIVVTPTRSSDYAKNASQNVTVINRKQIEESTARTIPDIIREEAGIVVREYSAGTGKQVVVDSRGFGETGLSNTLVLIDGRRVTQIDLSGTDWTQIPLEEVERIEVIRGAASVFYGDNATGGVINIITKRGKGKPKIEIKEELGSYASSNTVGEVSGDYKGINFYALGKYYKSSGYRDNNKFLGKDFGLKAGYKFSDLLNTQLSFGYHNDRYGLPGALYDIDLALRGRKGTIYPSDVGETKDYFGNLQVENDLHEWGKFSTNISMRTRQSKSNLYMDSFPMATDYRINTFGFNPKYLLDKPVFGRNNKVTLGFDFEEARDHVNSGYYNSENDVVNISKRSFGFYFFDQLSLLQKLNASFGWRYEHARYNFEQLTAVASQRSEAKKEREQVVSSGINYLYDDKDSSVYANYAESFRFPLVDEFYSSTLPAYGGGLNTALDAQRGKNYELGVKHYFTGSIYSQVNFYRMDIRNEIWLDPVTYKNSNYSKTKHQGVEFTSKARLWDKINLFANYAYTDARFVKGNFGGNQIPAVPVHKWAGGFDVDFLKGFNFSWITNFVGESYFISDQRNKFPRMGSYTTTDVRLAYKKEFFSLYGGIKNLFNEEYYEYGVVSGLSDKKTYYPSAERNFYVGGSLKF